MTKEITIKIDMGKFEPDGLCDFESIFHHVRNEALPKILWIIQDEFEFYNRDTNSGPLDIAQALMECVNYDMEIRPKKDGVMDQIKKLKESIRKLEDSLKKIRS